MKKRVGIIMGGPSAEREVALASGRRVADALTERGHAVVAIDWTGADHNLWADLRRENVDVAFVALHGTLGEDGCVQGLLGAPAFRTPDRACWHPRWRWTKSRPVECSMKPALKRRAGRFSKGPPTSSASASHCGEAFARRLVGGISIVRDEAQLDAALRLARRLHGVVLLEEFVAGREIEVAVLDGEVIGEVEVRPAGEFYDYAAKYQRTDTKYLVPAPLSPAERQLCHDLARRAHSALGCSGVTRTDLLLSPTGVRSVWKWIRCQD